MAAYTVNAEFVERYQLELSKNPRSRVFAPLSEAYRKMGLLDEAKRIGRFGTQAHPDFAGGHVAYAKVLLDSKAPAEALLHLEKATRLSPDNLLAHNLLGETLILLRRPKEALKAFKMVLFLSPENARAQEAVKKWEFLTADDYGEDVFAAKPSRDAALDDQLEDLLTESGVEKATGIESRMDLQQRHAKALERAVSLADAFTVRNDLDAAIRVLEDARRLLGPMVDIERRHKLISKRLEIHSDTDEESELLTLPDEGPTELAFDPPSLQLDRKREILENLLRRINRRGLRSPEPPASEPPLTSGAKSFIKTRS